MLVLKAAAVALGMAGMEVWALSSVTSPGGVAAQVAVLAAGVAGLHWLWRNLLRPMVRVLHRTAVAVETLETLPRWRRETDRRVRHLERQGTRLESGQAAILRELGLEDYVRRMYLAEDELAEREAEIDAEMDAGAEPGGE